MMKSGLTRVNSRIRTTAVLGIFMDTATKAAAPTTANAPGITPGQARLHASPMTVARSAPHRHAWREQSSLRTRTQTPERYGSSNDQQCCAYGKNTQTIASAVRYTGA